METKQKSKEILYKYEPSNVYCPDCNCWLARIFAVETEEGYFCKNCFEKRGC